MGMKRDHSWELKAGELPEVVRAILETAEVLSRTLANMSSVQRSEKSSLFPFESPRQL